MWCLILKGRFPALTEALYFSAAAHSVIHIFAKNCVFPQFKKQQWPNKGEVNLLPLFGGYIFGCPNTGRNSDGPKIPYKTRRFRTFCVIPVSRLVLSATKIAFALTGPKVTKTRDMKCQNSHQSMDHRVGRRHIYLSSC